MKVPKRESAYDYEMRKYGFTVVPINIWNAINALAPKPSKRGGRKGKK